MTKKYTKSAYGFLHDKLLDVTVNTNRGLFTAVPIVLGGTLIIGVLVGHFLIIDGARGAVKKLNRFFHHSPSSHPEEGDAITSDLKYSQR